MKVKKHFSIKKTFTTFVYVLLFIIIVFNVTLIVKSIVNRDETPSFFGIKSFVIVSGSMEPKLDVGDYILVKDVDPGTIKVGDVISFRSGNSIVTHRVVEIISNNGIKKYKTKGDNNNISDSELVSERSIEGLYLNKISKLGKIILALNNRVVLIATLLLLFVIYTRINRNSKKDKFYDDEYKEKEKNKKKKNKTLLFVYILLISAVVLVTFSLAKYKTTYATGKTARVAVMANSVNYTISGVKGKPGDVIVFPIELTNYDDDKTCEVDENFTLSINLTANIPLEKQLYKDADCEELVSDDGNGNYYDSNFNFNANDRDKKTYYLKLSWPRLENSSYYSLEIDSINIGVVVTQID